MKKNVLAGLCLFFAASAVFAGGGGESGGASAPAAKTRELGTALL